MATSSSVALLNVRPAVHGALIVARALEPQIRAIGRRRESAAAARCIVSREFIHRVVTRQSHDVSHVFRFASFQANEGGAAWFFSPGAHSYIIVARTRHP